MSQQSRANRCAIRTEATDPPPTPPTNPNTPLHPAARHVCIHVLKELASLGLFVLFVLVLLLVLFFSQPNRRSQVTKWYASTPSTPQLTNSTTHPHPTPLTGRLSQPEFCQKVGNEGSSHVWKRAPPNTASCRTRVTLCPCDSPLLSVTPPVLC